MKFKFKLKLKLKTSVLVLIIISIMAFLLVSCSSSTEKSEYKQVSTDKANYYYHPKYLKKTDAENFSLLGDELISKLSEKYSLTDVKKQEIYLDDFTVSSVSGGKIKLANTATKDVNYSVFIAQALLSHSTTPVWFSYGAGYPLGKSLSAWDMTPPRP